MRIPANVTLQRVSEAFERAQISLDNLGFCVACGAEAEDVEPDARQYTCESCGQQGVFGAEELLLRLALSSPGRQCRSGNLFPTRQSDMSICFYPCVYDPDQNQYTIPPAAQDKSDDFQLSLCNANGVDLLCALGLALEPSGVLPIEAFRNRLTAASRRRLDQRSPELEPAEQSEPGKVTVISLGRAEGYVERRLGELMECVQRALAIDATHIAWD